MYSENIRSDINELFSDTRTKVFNILDNNTSSDATVELVASSISSIITSSSKSMLDDMVAFLTKEQIEKLSTDAEKNTIYRANLRGEILGKYDFTIPADCIKYNEIPKEKTTLLAALGTAGVGGGLTYALTTIVPPIPVGWIIFSAVVSFLATLGVGVGTYKKFVPDENKKRLKKAVEECLDKIQSDLTNWFDEIEKYFNSRINEINSSK